MTQTIGHSEAYGGLRGHSIGSIYPMIVVCVGTEWRIQHPHWGLCTPTYQTAQEAHDEAVGLKRDFLKRQ